MHVSAKIQRDRNSEFGFILLKLKLLEWISVDTSNSISVRTSSAKYIMVLHAHENVIKRLIVDTCRF